jgi:high affinity Mn2+ porin
MAQMIAKGRMKLSEEKSSRRKRCFFAGFGVVAAMLLTCPAPLHAQSEPQSPPENSPAISPDPDPQPPTTMLGHLESKRIWISGQVNIISQWHPAFHSPYQGPNSLSPEAQDASSRVLTLYTGLRVSGTMEFLCDVQETGGHGLGEALGVAGFPNLDVVRNPLLTKEPYVARLMWHQIIPLGKGRTPAEPNVYSLFRELPERRLEFRVGKFSLVDFFEMNAFGTDTNFQFMNWTVDNNGAYDYAADTRGYTFGAITEYHQGNWTARFAETLMPKVANGIHLDADLSRAHAENMELEVHGRLRHRAAAVRLLAYVNHANMGSYREAVSNFLTGVTKQRPDITAHPLRTTVKYGFGASFEQSLNDWVSAFGRWGWNEGRHESFAYTEVDQTVELGLAGSGARWGRKLDRLGLAFVSNGISRDHQEYLKLGGLGFLLGDGTLRYGRESIIETFYTVHLWRGIFPAAGVQHIANPGYNRDRGPVVVPSLRLHIEF